MKLAFCGDSFCMCTGPFTNQISITNWEQESDENCDWPWLVAQHFNADIICSGIGGSNFFRSFQKLLGRIDYADYIIFCVTEPYRLINKHNLPMTKVWLDEITDPNSNFGKVFMKFAVEEPFENVKDYYNCREDERPSKEQILEAAHHGKYYFENIMDHGATEIMQQGFLMYVDNMMMKRNKKCIWLNCFTDSNKSSPGWPDAYIPQSGPMGNFSLSSISMTEAYLEKYRKKITHGERRNHFDRDQNIRMSEMIIDTIKHDSFGSGTLHMEDWFTELNSQLDEEQENDSDPFIYP